MEAREQEKPMMGSSLPREERRQAKAAFVAALEPIELTKESIAIFQSLKSIAVSLEQWKTKV